MRGVNKVILIGTCGADPETRYGANGSPITTLRLATNESWTDKATGAKQERTEWHRVKLFGRQVEVAAEYLRKGKQVYIEGKLRTDKYTDKEGVERFTTDIIADELQLLGGPGTEASGEQATSTRPQAAGQASARSRPATPARSQPAAPVGKPDFEDEIPF